MKNILSKLFEESRQREEKSPVVTYPQLAPLTSLQEVKDRAKVGWIAYRLATMLELNQERCEKLFYLSFSTNLPDNLDDLELKRILQLAESAVEWLQNDSNSLEQIKGLNLSQSHQNIVSRVISEVQMEEDLNEKSLDRSTEVWKVYRDVIYASTHGKFLLISKDEINKYKKGVLLCELDINERKDIPKARNMADNSFSQIGLKLSKAMSYKLIISEAVTNVLKHANDGKMLVYKDENVIRVIVEDNGKGFPLKVLPQTTLMAGFSTKDSLGQGFTLMMKIAEQIVLETTTTGSTLILILDGERDAENDNNK